MILKGRIRHLLLFLYHKRKNRDKVKFPYSASMSHRSEFEGMNGIGSHSAFYGRMGRGSYIGANCHISADIGRFSSLGNGLSQVVETHPYKEPFVTTSPLFVSMKKQTGYTFAKKQMMEEYKFYDMEREIAFQIGNDCWVGNGVSFIGGVHVGDGAVVLSRAIVTKDVPPYAIVGGIPAKVIGYRYDEETIKFLKEVQWWNQDIDWLKEHWKLFSDMKAFKQYWQKQFEA